MDLLINFFLFWLFGCFPFAVIMRDEGDLEGWVWLLILFIILPGYILSVYFFWLFPHFQDIDFMANLSFIDKKSQWFYWGLPLPFCFSGFMVTLVILDPRTESSYKNNLNEKLRQETYKLRKETHLLELQINAMKGKDIQEK